MQRRTSRRYLAMPASRQPFVIQPSDTLWSGSLNGSADEAIRGGT